MDSSYDHLYPPSPLGSMSFEDPRTPSPVNPSLLLHHTTNDPYDPFGQHIVIKPPVLPRLSLIGSQLAIPAGLALLVSLSPRFAQAALLIGPAAIVIGTSYQNFLNLGPGGTPSTPAGFLRITWLRCFAVKQPYVAPLCPDIKEPRCGLFMLEKEDPLPKRSGDRPIVDGIAPHRQLNQHVPTDIYLEHRRFMLQLSSLRPDLFGTGQSCFEKQGLALYSQVTPVNKTCDGEICHIHDTDHSMHLNLHPDDIKVVLDAGWGERHPLANRSWFRPNPVPETFTHIYGPRNLEELAVIHRIIQAAAWFVTGENVDITEAAALARQI